MNWSGVGAVLLAAGVMLGAFGAHALREKLDAYSIGIWEKAVFYHFIHALGLLSVPLFARFQLISESASDRICWLLLAGVLIFSGSLYALAISGIRALGAVTPFGGTAFIIAWLLLAWELFRGR
jgi:uncharacterized membrane protein YgdD (TMEM256/DUF423 family)